MSLPAELNPPAAATISDSTVLPIHDCNPKIYVACRNVAIQTEEICGEELHKAEVVHDGDIFLKVFYNPISIRGREMLPEACESERYWLNRHARQKPFFSDLSEDEDEDYENTDYNDIYHLHSLTDPKSVVWRRCANAKPIDSKTIFANAVSGLQARDIGIQIIPEQVCDDLFYTDEALFNEIVDNAIFTDDDSALFDGDVVEWDN